MKRNTSEEYLGKYEVVFGQHLDNNDPQLSPKANRLVQDKLQIEKIFFNQDDFQTRAMAATDPTVLVNKTAGPGIGKDASLKTVTGNQDISRTENISINNLKEDFTGSTAEIQTSIPHSLSGGIKSGD